ncbi:FkbM family methyltransferase [Candidatus Pelagibacter sp.]|nr:FkbM family methyltransferase [Candidatus Pelagibacter sp.]
MKDFGLVVIGAHFGVWLEQEISKYSKQDIILVEPVPYNIDILEKKYSSFKNITICKNAIFSENKVKSFYFVDENSITKLGKHWASAIGSFDKKHILNHKSKRFKIEDSDIKEIKIEFITFDKLVEKYSIQSIDKLQIDVEGAEYEILKTIDFKKTKIDQILFESKHFDGTFTEGKKLQEIKQKLISDNYKLTQIDKENILAKK